MLWVEFWGVAFYPLISLRVVFLFLPPRKHGAIDSGWFFLLSLCFFISWSLTFAHHAAGAVSGLTGFCLGAGLRQKLSEILVRHSLVGAGGNKRILMLTSVGGGQVRNNKLANGSKKERKDKRRQKHINKCFAGLSRDILGILFMSKEWPPNHIHTSLKPTQSQDNPQNLFMFMCFFLSLILPFKRAGPGGKIQHLVRTKIRDGETTIITMEYRFWPGVGDWVRREMVSKHYVFWRLLDQTIGNKAVTVHKSIKGN